MFARIGLGRVATCGHQAMPQHSSWDGTCEIWWFPCILTIAKGVHLRRNSDASKAYKQLEGLSRWYEFRTRESHTITYARLCLNLVSPETSFWSEKATREELCNYAHVKELLAQEQDIVLKKYCFSRQEWNRKYIVLTKVSACPLFWTYSIH